SIVDETIRAAIAARRLISFELDRLPRVAEPHDYGGSKGVLQLFFFRVGGKRTSGAALGWRTAVISKVSGIKVLERRFAGPRPAPSGRHKQWDELIASVSRS